MFRAWFQERFNTPIMYPSSNAYVIERNTMKGIANMLKGSWLYKHHNIGEPSDQGIIDMWAYMLNYIKEKNNYCYNSLLSIHRNYNSIIAMIQRHNAKEQYKTKAAAAATAQQKLTFIQKMMGGQ